MRRLVPAMMRAASVARSSCAEMRIETTMRTCESKKTPPQRAREEGEKDMERENETVTRREALKVMGLAALGAGIAMTPLAAAEPNKKASAPDVAPDGTASKRKVVLVNGSPHRNGCTHAALSEVEKTLNENGVDTEIFWIGNNVQGGCIACNYCREHGKCVRDDTVNVFVEKAKAADGFVFGSPVHFAGPSGSMHSFMIRAFYCVYGSDVFADKPAAAVVSCRRAGATAALDTMNKFFPISGMPIVPSQYWNMVHGNTPDDVRQDLEGLQIMRTLGRKMAWMLKGIESGRRAGVPAPEREPFLRTDFIR